LLRDDHVLMISLMVYSSGGCPLTLPDRSQGIGLDPIACCSTERPRSSSFRDL
jgi:hypothetical protein